MSQHTPKPWLYDGSNSITDRFKETGICILEPLEEFWRGDVTRYPSAEEQAANGYLMAAAPELLEACEAVLPILRAYIPPDQFDGHAARALILVRDAINKAKRESVA